MADTPETAQMCVKTDILGDTIEEWIAYSYHIYQYDIFPFGFKQHLWPFIDT